MTTHQPEHQRHRNRSLQDTGNGKLEYGADDEGKCVVQVHSRWNNIHLSLVCVLLGISLIMMLDGCRSSSGSWVLLGSAGTLIWDWTSVCVVLLFTVLQVALYYLPVGQVTEGKMGCDGKRLKYKLNGLHAFLLTVVLMLVLWFAGVLQAGAGTVRIFSLVSAAMAVSLIFSLALFLCPIRTPSSAHVTYNTAKPLLKFVLGHNMDPRLGLIDVKHFVMVRVGFIGWAVMDLNYLLTAVEMKNSSLALLLVIVFQLIYILDFLIDEGSVLTTKEFTNEPIGFIMILGEFIWIPFFSSLPAYFLLQRPNHIHFLSAVPICLLFAAGFLMYYLSNEQKDGFRRNPSDPAYARLNTIRSPAGSSLLVSGWFGWVRHPNYSGDILMMFAWCLPCGFTSVLPYLPALQCFHLLRQRANEIEESCLKKHRDAWREYCRRVPYKLLPYVY
ncbi:delta(14)-sterol reductase isoform X2 [Sinocyclocheilus anshuiensis]|uniref:delta(14)-sterol reductase isoform X2 n=1 Tax=Sinocyclocheilus anshuiensis TaxID=1608454 RepID=UPI0007B85854|nr:PREDICTED: delta(14)-sterol reductase-like isoform X2 [Sinocyclocheilus anshuiensis]